MNNSLLSNIKHHTCLGVFIDSKMSWIQHIAYVKNKVAKGIEPILIGKVLSTYIIIVLNPLEMHQSDILINYICCTKMVRRITLSN